jgi:hypothetical protein
MLREKLLEQKDGIISYLVRRLKKLCAKIELSKGSLVSQKAMQSFKVSNNIIGLFFEQCIENATHQSLPKAEIWQVFNCFCREKNESVRFSYDTFFRLVKKSFPTLSEYRVHTRKHGRPYCYKGVTLSDYGFWLLSQNSKIRRLHSERLGTHSSGN